MKQRNEWVEPFIAQHLAYSFLSKVLYEPPSEALIRNIVQEDLFAEWPLPGSNARTDEGLKTLQQFTRDWHDERMRALERDYARLFLGPGKLLAPPWESVYRSPKGLIFERQTLEVRQFFQRAGMPIPNLGTEPDDHIGLELRFVAYLCAQGLYALEINKVEAFDAILETLCQFFAAHLSQWADQCFDQIAEHAETRFYRGIAQLASGCLAHTRAMLDAPCEALSP